MKNDRPDTEKHHDFQSEEKPQHASCSCECLWPGLWQAGRTAMIWRGIVFIIFGILLLLQPLATLTLIVMILGIYAIIEGAALLVTACQVVRDMRPLIMFNGIVLILLGIAAIIFPWLMGEYAIIFLGAWQLVSGIQCLWLLKCTGFRWKNLFTGIFAMLSGIFFIFAPFLGMLTLTWIFAILFFISGFMLLCSSFSIPRCA